VKKILKSFIYAATFLTVVTAIFVYRLQYMQGPAGTFRFEGDIQTLSYYQDVDNVTHVGIKLDNVAVFCEKQADCDSPQYEEFYVRNVGINELELGQHVSLKCVIAPVRWTLNILASRVTCEVVK